MSDLAKYVWASIMLVSLVALAAFVMAAGFGKFPGAEIGVVVALVTGYVSASKLQD